MLSGSIHQGRGRYPPRCHGPAPSQKYRVPQFCEAIQSRQNITVLGALGTPCLAVFSGTYPLLPRGDATYNQWAFEVHSLQSCCQEGGLQEGIIWSLKVDAADMV